jgi:CDP-glycerol glycerophosphotransferase (TagB/SpsB family)
MLKVTNATVLYKPHPKVTTSPKPKIANAHKKILALLDSANSKDPSAKHRLVTGDPMPVLQVADLLVSDVSAVTIDYLYLKPQGAMLMCDRRSNVSEFAQVAPVSKAVTVITKDNINSIDKLISDHVSGQVDRTSYDSMRNYYFGDTKPGSSINRFIAMVDDLIKRRDKKVLELPTSK